jgi:hypothetical protein
LIKNEQEKRKKPRVDFGFLWSVLRMNNEYKRVLLNLSNVSKVGPKLRPDFIFIIGNSFSLQSKIQKKTTKKRKKKREKKSKFFTH